MHLQVEDEAFGFLNVRRVEKFRGRSETFRPESSGPDKA